MPRSCDTGKVLIIAGSGNNLDAFKAGTFKSLLWDPKTNTFKQIHTPSDMFCAGHAYLPDGKLLIAGGTKRYEVLAQDVKRAAGVMTVQNESPNYGVHPRQGTACSSGTAASFRSTQRRSCLPATKVVNADGDGPVAASSAEIWVEAVARGRTSVVEKPTQFAIEGFARDRAPRRLRARRRADARQQDYWGDDKSYIFDPVDRALREGRQPDARALVPDARRTQGRPRAGGLGARPVRPHHPGRQRDLRPGDQAAGGPPQLERTFPTYPSLFLMPSGNLFYSGSNAGYGSATVGRTPGIWDLDDNTFKVVPGLRDPKQTETSGSVLLPPAQDQRYMIAGGGGVGDSPRSTARTDIVDLTAGRAALHARARPRASRPVIRTWSSRPTTRS